jgi:hypothetical protein
MFWKKDKEEFPGLDTGLPGIEPNLPGLEPAMPGTPEDFTPQPQTTFQPPGSESLTPESFERKTRLQPTSLETKQEYTLPKDMEIISAKLENLRLSFEVLNQKLDNIERMLKEKRTW